MSEYSHLIDFALEQGQAARELARTGSFVNWEKPDGSDVSDADGRIQDDFNEAVRRRGHEAVWGEEANLLAEDPKIIWSVDPIDGSTAREWGMPTFMFGAAAIDPQSHIILASVICNLSFEDDYWAMADSADAYNNGSPIYLSERMPAEGLRIGGTGSNRDRQGVQSDTFYKWKQAENGLSVARTRISGVPTLFRAVQVARGRLDAASYKGTHLHDVAAGVGLVSRARRRSSDERGIAADLRGNPHALDSRNVNGAIFASSLAVRDVMVEELKDVQARF